MPSVLQQQPQDARDVRGTLMDLLNLLESRIRQQPQGALRFSVSEVEALFELFKSISATVIDDGLINNDLVLGFQFHHWDNCCGEVRLWYLVGVDVRCWFAQHRPLHVLLPGPHQQDVVS